MSAASLKDRLGALMRQVGGPAAPARAAWPAAKQSLVADDLSSRIGALRDAQRIRDRQRTQAERGLPGEELATGVRLVRHVERLPAFGFDAPAWEADPGGRGRPLVFLDTETTGLSGGTGTLVFLCGLAQVVDQAIVVEQLLLTRPSSEAAWLEAMAQRMPADATLVSFNGKAFDVPLLTARHALHRRRCPFAGKPHWDLLAPTRRAFDTRWPDCRLQTAEKRLLGIARVDDLPGSFAPAAFTTLLRTGDSSLVQRVIEHNRHDLVALAHLLVALDRVYREPERFDADLDAVARKLIDLGQRERAGQVLEHAVATQTAARRTLAELRRRERRWDAAGEQWSALAARNCVHAIEALAKLEEHVRRNPARALAHAEQLAALEPVNPRHRRRIERLTAKIGRSGPLAVKKPQFGG